MDKKNILKKFYIDKKKEKQIQIYLKKLKECSAHTNIVGRSTLDNPWTKHVLDSLQIIQFIENKQSSILDMGTGAGLPGFILAIAGCSNVTMIDSNNKKIKFIKEVQLITGVKADIILGRIEAITKKKYDIVVSRALANLTNLLSYSQKFVHKNTVLIFLKGKTVNEEIEDAKKKWNFNYTKQISLSDTRGNLLFVRNLFC